MPGTYKVDIITYAPGGGAEGRLVSGEASADAASLQVPARYNDPKQTVLTFTIEAPGTDTGDFELTTD